MAKSPKMLAGESGISYNQSTKLRISLRTKSLPGKSKKNQMHLKVRTLWEEGHRRPQAGRMKKRNNLSEGKTKPSARPRVFRA